MVGVDGDDLIGQVGSCSVVRGGLADDFKNSE